jgi:hypothetical protein
MKLLHILKSEPDETVKKLMALVSQGHEVQTFNLYEDAVDYQELVRLIMNTDKNISWW